MTIFRSSTWYKRDWSNSYANTDDFRQWGSALDECLEGVGLSKINSTIDWETVTFPTSSYTNAGSTDYSFPNNGYKPLYVRVIYGSNYLTTSSSYYNHLMFRVQISYDAGFTEFATYPYYWGTGQYKYGLSENYWEASFDDETLVVGEKTVAEWIPDRTPGLIIIERSRNDDYSISGTGAYVQCVAQSLNSSSINYGSSYSCQMYYPENLSDPEDVGYEHRGILFTAPWAQGYSTSVVPENSWNLADENGQRRVMPYIHYWNGVPKPQKATIQVSRDMVPNYRNIDIVNDIAGETATYTAGAICGQSSTEFMMQHGENTRVLYRYQ
jgi:hypothetical protein